MTTLTGLREGAVIVNMALPLPLLTAADALAAAREPLCYLLRIAHSEAAGFSGPGWMRLDPVPREDGSVLFIHRERELLAVRARGVL